MRGIRISLFLLLAVSGIKDGIAESLEEEEARAKAYIKDIEGPLSEELSKKLFADFAYELDLEDDEKQQLSITVGLAFAKYRKDIWKNFTSFNWRKFKDPPTRRLLDLESLLGVDILEEAKLEFLIKTINAMKKIYSTAKICNFSNPTQCDMTLDGDIIEMFANSRNYDELEHTWLSWYKESGGKMQDLFKTYVDIFNEGAKANNLRDTSDLWLHGYQNDFIPQHAFAIYGQIKPLYVELHAYVRRKLRLFYGEDKFPICGQIPAHLLGNMWAQGWGSIGDITVPFKDIPTLDVTSTMVKKGYTPLKMFQDAEDFFKSLGMDEMVPSFWTDSVFTKPEGKEMVCHPSAWDFNSGKDFRIKMCTKVNMKDYVTVHHEMGHIQYYMHYRNQLCTFREGAHQGFQEAAGDTISMSVKSVKHLKKIGLLENYEENKEGTINFLFNQAMTMFVDMPFGLMLDQWRWDVFQGRINQSEYNCHWWKLKEEFQGITPPKQRTSKDFDPGGKYHVPASVPYIRYFFAKVLTYQFHEALCRTAGQYDPNDPEKPLHECSIYGSKEAGAKYSSMLELGSSIPWQEALAKVTGKTMMDAMSIISYYKPLFEWLQEENKKNNESVGWSSPSNPSCVYVD